MRLMRKVAFITGVTGQDGSYLAEFLLGLGYTVHGMLRRTSTFSTTRLNHLMPSANLHLHFGDLQDPSRIANLIREINPDEIYNLGAQSHVRVSFEEALSTAQITGIGNLAALEGLRLSGVEARFYQASSSEMYGSTPPMQNEDSPFAPRSPYAVSKLFAHWMTIQYREAYNLHASTGILFNHESPRRGLTFVTRKISRGAARIKKGLESKLSLGNLSATRDWGYAPDYVVGMWLMLQQDSPGDYVLATGKGYTVQQYLEHSFSLVGLDWQDYVTFDDKYLRPNEVVSLIGDPARARNTLGWSTEIDGLDLADLILRNELALIENPEYIDTPQSSLWSRYLN